MINLFISSIVINDDIPVMEYAARSMQWDSNIGIFPTEIIELRFMQAVADIVGEYRYIHIGRNIFQITTKLVLLAVP